MTPRKKLRNSRVVAWIGVMVLLFGIASAAYGVYAIASGLASKRWPTVPGWITESEVVEVPQPYGTTYHAVIRYRYTVDGAVHTGKRVSFRNGGSTLELAEQKARRYPPGSAVNVHYDPEDPGNAALEPGMNSRDCLLTGGLMSFLFFIGLLVLWMAARMRRDALRELGLPGEQTRPATAANDEPNPYRM